MRLFPVTLVLIAALDVMVPAQAPAIVEFQVPTPNAFIGGFSGIAAGRDGNVWFTESAASKVARITPEGIVTEFTVPGGINSLGRLVAGPDGRVWFIEYLTGSCKIAAITTSAPNAIVEYDLPVGSSAQDVAVGSDDNIWFTDSLASKVGRMTTAGAVTEFSLPPGHSVSFITPGPDGNLWFREGNLAGASNIARITPAGVITIVAPGVGTANGGLTVGPDNNIWFVQAEAVGRLTVNGAYSKFQLNSAGAGLGLAGPGFIVTGPDGNLWLTTYASRIFRITIDGVVTEFPIPFSGTAAITPGPGDGSLWFTEVANRIGRLTPANLPAIASAAVLRPATGEWFIRSPTGPNKRVPWGCGGCGDEAVPADYDGDGKADIAVYRAGSTGEWFILQSSDGETRSLQWGNPALGDQPKPADYDGDGIADIAVYRSSTGQWFVLRSSDHGLTVFDWGCPDCGDVPVPAKY
jgi:streptogramin lyase